MKLTITKERFLEGLKSVQNVAETLTTLPILSNVLMEADGERLQITATDLDLTVSTGVEARVLTPGSTTLPARRLFEIVREFPNPEIEMELEKSFCVIQGGSSFYKIHALPAADFPVTPAFDSKNKVVVPQKKIATMQKRTAFAASTDETRYVLNGSFLSFNDHKVTMVATDGRRLALAEEEAEIPAEFSGEIIVPNKAITELGRLLKDDGDVEIQYTENQIAFLLVSQKGFTTKVISKRVDGNYPNYRQVIVYWRY